MDPIMAAGCNPKKRLKATAPSRNAFPRDSFFLIRRSTSTNTIPILIMAGMWCKTDMCYFRLGVRPLINNFLIASGKRASGFL